MRKLSLAASVLAVLLFLLPWVTVSCGGQEIVTLSGLDLAVGKRLDLPEAPGLSARGDVARDWKATVALAAGLVAIAVGFGGVTRARSMIAGACGILGGVLLLLLQGGEKPEAVVTLEFRPWYWLSLVLFLAGGLGSAVGLLREREAPPPRASSAGRGAGPPGPPRAR